MDIIELLKAIIIGIVEGITEWLPVSSTGHMIVVDDFLQLNVSEEFKAMFLVVIQLGAILAVIILYFHRLNPFSRRKSKPERGATWRLWGKVVLACIPAAIIGGLLDDWMEEHIYNAVTVSIALVAYGIAFIIVEKVKRDPLTARPLGAHTHEAIAARSAAAAASQPNSAAALDSLSIPRALGIGLFQCLAIVPGTSRSGSTILGGRILGVSREAAAEFSFFLAIPVMLGWSLLKLVKMFWLDHVTLTNTEWGVFATGIIVAFGISVLAIKFLMGFIKKHSFAAFGWYRIAAGLALLAYFAYAGRLFAI